MSSSNRAASRALLMFAAALLLISCDATSSEDISVAIEPSEWTSLREAGFELDVDATGALTRMLWERDGAAEWIASLAGLWLAVETDGEVEASVVWAGSTRRSNLLAPAGVYRLTREDLVRRVTGWPADLGAPATPDGQPVLYGDAMTWQRLHPDATNPDPELSRPIEGLTVSQAVFAYGRIDLEDLLFLEYTITNAGDRSLGGIHAGFYADIDLASCGTASRNAVGYDFGRALSYTYEVTEGATSDCDAVVAGYSFLSDPLDEAILSHRIMRKNDDPDFGEENVQEPRQLLYALQGLTNAGLPMIHPQSGDPTRFAFTGDPVAGEGWLDDSTDVRSLLSIRPFDLAPGESRRLTVVLGAASGPSLGIALSDLRSRLDAVRRRPSLWTFQ